MITLSLINRNEIERNQQKRYFELTSLGNEPEQLWWADSAGYSNLLQAFKLSYTKRMKKKCKSEQKNIDYKPKKFIDQWKGQIQK